MPEKSTLIPSFPHYIIFRKAHFASGCGVISLHRKSNLPAEESGIKTVERIGNETHDGGAEAFAADVMTEAKGKGGATRRTQAIPG